KTSPRTRPTNSDSIAAPRSSPSNSPQNDQKTTALFDIFGQDQFTVSQHFISLEVKLSAACSPYNQTSQLGLPTRPSPKTRLTSSANTSRPTSVPTPIAPTCQRAKQKGSPKTSPASTLTTGPNAKRFRSGSQSGCNRSM